MVNEREEPIAVFVATPKIKQIAQPKNLIPQLNICKRSCLKSQNKPIINYFISVIVKATTIWQPLSFLTVFQSLTLPHLNALMVACEKILSLIAIPVLMMRLR